MRKLIVWKENIAGANHPNFFRSLLLSSDNYRGLKMVFKM